ncbi:hypothetical protein Ahy_B05g073977 isoform C [Arachis hypogaea]|uniref:Non-haem dioxygenase N-terminal domain-containing protein n=1 Tax=Arachis hypogaea TaxID=3818 RepID=A0A444YXK3_ARAHY|nr:hypothetical protein Ahy_B05g073977 isoform C [Arachis hypogaea]
MMEADHEDGSYDRNKELKLLEETKAGVKGLVDAGLTKLPKIFVHDGHKVNISSSSSATNVSIPVIDLGLLHEEGNSRHEIIQKVKDAGEKWDFFQVVNCDIPPCVLDEMLDGVRRFHEQDAERLIEGTPSLVYWHQGPLTVTNSLPFAVTIKYLDHVKKLALTLLEIRIAFGVIRPRT